MARRAGFPLIAALCALAAGHGLADAPVAVDGASAVETAAPPPLGLPPVSGLRDAERNAARVALGRRLFFDPRLSRDGNMACASCHHPAHAFAGPRAPSPGGSSRAASRRDIPTLLNVAYATSLFRDGRAASLEEQVAGPLFAPDEMANASPAALVARLAGLEEYRHAFRRAFGGGPTVKRIAGAIAAFERMLLSGNSPFDRWFFGGDPDALSATAKRGYRLFVGRARCVACHTIGDSYALFTDNDFHFIGTGYRTAVERARRGGAPPPIFVRAREPSGMAAPEIDLGRQEVTGRAADQWRYRTPSLRNVALTAPYMHDGSFASLEEVVLYYNYTGVWHPRLDERIRPIGLTRAEIRALVAFLESLTGDYTGSPAPLPQR